MNRSNKAVALAIAALVSSSALAGDYPEVKDGYTYIYRNHDEPTQSVPEPASILILGTGAAAAIGVALRRRRK